MPVQSVRIKSNRWNLIDRTRLTKPEAKPNLCSKCKNLSDHLHFENFKMYFANWRLQQSKNLGKRRVCEDWRSTDPVGTSSQWSLTFGWLLCGSCPPCLGSGESQHWPSNSLSTYCLSDCTGTGRSNIRTDLSTDLEMAACPKMYQKEGQLILAS